MLFLVSLYLLFTSPSAVLEIELQSMETWHHDRLFGGIRFGMTVDGDGALIGQFQKDMPFMMTAERVVDLRPRGEGPGDLQSSFGIGFRGRDLVVVEFNGKIKTFNKVNGAYDWQGSIYRKAEPSSFMIDDVAWSGDRFFLAGFTIAPTDRSDEFVLTELKAYDSGGKALGDLVSEQGSFETFVTRTNWVERHLRAHDDRLYYMTEKHLTVHLFDPGTLKEIEAVTLPRPAFYRPAPKGHFRVLDKQQRYLTGPELMGKRVDWRKSYSRVENMVVTRDYLVLQLRTASARLPRFGLCFYDRNNGFSLEGISYTDDLLVAGRDGLLYLMAGGHPGVDDDEIDQTVVSIVRPVLPR